MRVKQLKGPAKSLTEVACQASDERAVVVATDASWQDGLAGLGFVKGEHRRSKVVGADNNMHAEALALAWAMQIMAAMPRVVFMLDCRTVVDWARGVRRHRPALATESEEEREARVLVGELYAAMPGWRVVHVERQVVALAHVEAKAALRAIGR
jgi:hypothetical protein